MDIKRNGSQPSTKGRADWFSGTVRIDPLFRRPIQHGRPVPASLSSPVRGPRGTPIRSARR